MVIIKYCLNLKNINFLPPFYGFALFPKSKMEPLQMQHCFAIVDLMTDCCEMGILALLVASKHTVGKWKCTCCNVNTVYVYSLCIFYKNDFRQNQ